ncbi:hypothetical protein [Brevibacillus daliensis]|uniref:hypothetical protein n=1 Tax=Brevibacillus daliensis TaxID=2892995 RepID=UPI001E2DDBB2|nr:hypothetical protein [Brevibacillus daliensis]
MGRPRKPDDELKKDLKIRLPGWLREKVKSHPEGATGLIERLLKEYFQQKKK